MARQDFLANLWRVGDRFSLRRVYPRYGQDDGSRSYEDQLANAALWLTPDTVSGFSIDDFPELDDHERSKLEGWVRQFGEIAEAAGSNQPIPESLANKAFMCLNHISNSFMADVPVRSETLKINKALRRIRYPESVQFLDFEVGDDSTGDPAIWVWVVMDDGAASRKSFAQESSTINRQIHDAISRAGIDRWPYVRYRTLSEHLELSGQAAR